jgi:hypothetical protein
VAAPSPPAAPPGAPTLEDDWSEVDLSATPGSSAPRAEEAPHAASAVRGGLPRPIALEEEPRPPHAPIDLGPAEGEAELAPMHAFVPPPEATGHKPEAAEQKAGDAGEAQLRDALSKASREVIEKIVWEVVPQLAEAIIRENLDRLLKERQNQ